MDTSLKTNNKSTDEVQFKSQKLEIPKIQETLNSDLVQILNMYDQILINHIATHYYDGQITEDVLKRIKEKLKENKKKIYN
jgi:hypothetical protein